MAAGKGSLLILKIGDGASPASFTTVAGVLAKTMTINNEQVNITTDDTAPWRRLLAGAGERSMTISGNGINKDDAQLNSIRTLALNGELEDFQIVEPSGDIFEGQFQVASFEQSGDSTAANLFSISLESGGPITLTTV